MHAISTAIRFAIFIFIGVLHIKNASAQYNLEWAERFGYNSFSPAFNPSIVKGYAIATDHQGNVYTAGRYSLIVDFDPGTGIYADTAAGGFTYSDIFIQKLDTGGHFLWTRTFGANYHDIAYDITIDNFGNSYTTGIFNGNLDFNPHPIDSFVMDALNGSAFILKLDPAGNFVWAKQLSITTSRICYDKNQFIYLTGTYGRPPIFTTDFDPSPSIFNLTTNGGTDAFVLKLDLNGDFIWARSVGGPQYDTARAITCDRKGDVYFTGEFNTSADFDPGSSTHIISSYTFGTTDFRDMFIEKLDSAGNYVWVDVIGNTGYDQALDIAVDSLCRVYVTGRFFGQLDFDPGPAIHWVKCPGVFMNHQIYALKLNADGSLNWIKQTGSPGFRYECGRSISVDANMNVYTMGNFYGIVDFDPGLGIANLDWLNGSCFVQKLDSNGNFIFAQQIGDHYTQWWSTTYYDQGNCAELDAAGYFYITGILDSMADFNPSSLVYPMGNLGNHDGYSVKLSQCINPGSIEVVKACGSYTWFGKTYSVSGIYFDTLSTVKGCDSMITLNLAITQLNDSIFLDGITLEGFYSTANTQFQWIDCTSGNIPIVGASNSSFTPTSNGSYALIISDIGCIDTTDCLSVNNIEVYDIQFFENIIVKPNPSKGLFQIELPESVFECIINIADFSGRVLIQKSYINQKTIHLNLQEYSNGIYFLNILLPTHQWQTKLMKSD
ncbi:MAG: T9SS type A sorting domain-containing protein [Bacteroidetes bacterium]|nr:T9SS type A sorting domain-containing protein [Bacteroidota bacterium]